MKSIPQQIFNSAAVDLFFDERAVDEVRIGKALPGIMLGTQPLR